MKVVSLILSVELARQVNLNNRINAIKMRIYTVIEVQLNLLKTEYYFFI